MNQLVRVIFVVLFLCSMSGVHGQKLPSVLVDSPLTWLEVRSSSDPLFSSKVASAIDTNKSSMLAPVLPYSVVVTNAGTVPISGIAIRFALTINTKTVTRDFFYHSFNQPARPVIPPGASRIFTPLKTANAIAAGAVSAQGRGGVGPLTSPNELSAMRSLAAANEIRASIDLAVAPDGRTAGQDKMSTLRKFNSQAQAYRDMRDEILARIKRGDSDESILQWLNSLSNQMVFRDSQTGLADRYSTTQVQQATEWQGYLKSGKRSELESHLLRTTPEILFAAVIALRGGLQ